MDCGAKLDKPTYNRGDVCKKCFDAFSGATIEELTDYVNEALSHD